LFFSALKEREREKRKEYLSFKLVMSVAALERRRRRRESRERPLLFFKFFLAKKYGVPTRQYLYPPNPYVVPPKS